MNWWLDLGKVLLLELTGKDDLSNSEIPQLLFNIASKIKKDRNPYLSIVNKTLLNNYIVNPKNKSKQQSEEDIKKLFTASEESQDVNCSYCSNMTASNKESIASRKWMVSGGWENSPLYAGGGSISPRICLNCRKLSLLAAFKAYELFIENKLPFIIYNPNINLYRTLIKNLILRKDLSLNFEKSSSVFLSLGSMLIYPNFDKQGNIESFDIRPLLPKASLMLMNLTGLLRTKAKEQYILEIIEKYKENIGIKLISDYLKQQSRLDLNETITAFYAFLKAYKGGVGMTKKFFEIGKELGNQLEDKAYSVALKLYKSIGDSTQFQRHLIGTYIYLKEPMPLELTEITNKDENALAFIMGLMSSIKNKEV
ncbi:MAG: hypothetical protein RMI30_06330 [Thermodesulfovibrio sp.]|nr:hypothetical protein [Thermodesulfovibrio sp.]MDW7999050.1 hypothetical protein [Thermodesulfovibrio sp.]